MNDHEVVSADQLAAPTERPRATQRLQGQLDQVWDDESLTAAERQRELERTFEEFDPAPDCDKVVWEMTAGEGPAPAS